jgi:hypothetical protein
MNFRNPVYNAFGTIDCEIEHPQYGWIPFTASPADVEDYGRQIFDEAKAIAAPCPPPQPPSDAEIAAQVRSERNRLLAASDWTQVADAPVDQAAWAEYRQALRNVTRQAGFPHSIAWPSKP